MPQNWKKKEQTLKKVDHWTVDKNVSDFMEKGSLKRQEEQRIESIFENEVPGPEKKGGCSN